MTATEHMPYMAEFRDYSPERIREGITDYAGDFVDHFDVDAVVRDYATELETQLGPDWSLDYDGIEHPADLPRVPRIRVGGGRPQCDSRPPHRRGR